MKWLEWQEALLNNYDDLDIFEVMAIRGSGKTTLSLGWVCKDADLSIFITSEAKSVRDYYKEKIKSMGLKYNELHIVANLEQIKKINTKTTKKIKVVVDDYFHQSDVTLKKLDDVIGHDQYKVLFIGARRNKEDKFKIPFSKQFYVGLTELIKSEVISLDHFIDIVNCVNKEQLQLEFGAPFEAN